MNKKRLLALLLALCMVFALFACGDDYYYEDDDDDDDDDDEGTSQTTEDTDPTGDNTDPTGDNTDPTTGNNDSGNSGTPVLPPDSGNDDSGNQQPSINPNYPQPNPNAPNQNPDHDDNQQPGIDPEPIEPEPIEPAVNTILGNLSGNVYTNKYVGFQVTFPEAWSYHPVSSSVDPENPFPGTFPQQIMDLTAQDNRTGISINVVYQNPNIYNGNISANNTEEQNIDLMLAEEDTLRQTYQSMGYTLNSLTKDYIVFAGEEHYVMKSVLTAYNTQVVMVQMYTYGSGNTPVIITIGGRNMTDIQTVLAMVTAL